MKPERNSSRRALALLASVVFVIGIAYIFLTKVGMVPTPSTCMTESKVRITNLSGGDFEITDTDCDFLAKEEFVSVYVSRARTNGGSLLAKWFRGKTLLFRYDPAMLDSPLPVIRASGSNRILISIPRVSSVMFQSKKWNNVSIDYEIEQVDFPVTGAIKEAP